eukprot:2514565-Amphidinium_carterae.1
MGSSTSNALVTLATVGVMTRSAANTWIGMRWILAQMFVISLSCLCQAGRGVGTCAEHAQSAPAPGVSNVRHCLGGGGVDGTCQVSCESPLVALHQAESQASDSDTKATAANDLAVTANG